MARKWIGAIFKANNKEVNKKEKYKQEKRKQVTIEAKESK